MSNYLDHLEQAKALHREMLTLDTHCDTPSMMLLQGWDLGARHPKGTLLGGDLDLVRMKEGGLAAAFMAVYLPQGPRTDEGHAQARSLAEEMLDVLDAAFLQHASLCERALTSADARRIHAAGKRALFIGLENGYPLGRELSRLDHYHQRGVRYVTLCHAADNDLCASCTGGTSPQPGLTDFGAQVVRRMNSLGMMVDISHTSEATVHEVLSLSQAPVIASHSGASAVHPHPRNLSDRTLKALAARGGVIQALFVPFFLRPEAVSAEARKAKTDLETRVWDHYETHAIGADPQVDQAFEAEFQAMRRRHPAVEASVSDVADHIDHMVQLVGIDHVGIGSDFDGGGCLRECQDVSELPALTAELLRRGYREEGLRKIWGGNLLRVLDQVQACATP